MKFTVDPVMAGFYKAQAEAQAKAAYEQRKQEAEAARRAANEAFRNWDPSSWQFASDESMKKMWDESMAEMLRNAGKQQYQGDWYRYATPPPEQPIQADCFNQLGIPATATKKEVITAFRKLAPAAHPDTGGSTEKFQKLNNAKMEALKRARE